MIMTEEENMRLTNDALARETWDLRVYVVGGGHQYIKMFSDAGFKGARSVEDANIICFTGGEDVDPEMYGEKPLPGTNYNTARDAFEAGIYGECLALKKPMIGICRGSQFLNVMNGGKLWQDINKHATMRGHDITDMKTGETRFNMTSTHHQQMIPANDAEILALAEISTHKHRQDERIEREKPELDDVEVVYYPSTLSLCFQPHPEFHHGECRNYFLSLVDEYTIPAC